MRKPVLRLTGLVTVLVLIGLVTAAFVPISRAGLREAIEPFGPFAAPVFVVAAAVLALVFVPGPILAAASGVLFGTALGFVVSLASTMLTSVLALLIARRAGGSALEEVSGERVLTLTDLARRHGTLAVVVQRLVPGVADAPMSYAFGLIGLRAHQIALGTLIGSAPRAFSYTALGHAAASGDSTLAVVAVVVGVAVSVLGIVVGGVLLRSRQTIDRSEDPGR